MIQSFASSIAGRPVSETWVTRFLNRNSDKLISHWATSMDRVRHKADSLIKHELYFQLLHETITEYEIEPRNTYNMDEKGFLIGVVGRSKRVFDRHAWEAKTVRQALQDGNKEWVTILGCVSADGTWIPPTLVYPAAGRSIQSSWVNSIEAEKH